MKKRFTVLILTLILAVGLLSGCSTENNGNDNSQEESYVPVEIQTVGKDRISNSTMFSGKVYADKDVMVFPKVPGKVTRVDVELGQKVSAGNILFTLDKDDIQKQVDQARVALSGAKANYQLTKERIDNAKENLERTRKLYQEGAISQSQLEQAELAASDKSLEAAKSGMDQAQVGYNQAVDALNNTSVESPIDGVVSAISIEAGEMASNAQPAVTIVDMNRVYIQINVTESLINQLYEGQEAIVNIPSAADFRLIGKISNISPAADQRTQLYPVKIFIDNKEHIIKPGMLAQVKIHTEIKEDVVVVRSESVVEKNGESFVYVVENDLAVERKVETGLDTGSLIEIVQGVKAGDKVIVKGQNYVEDKTKVKVVRGE